MDSFDKTKYLFSLSHQRSTTVSFEASLKSILYQILQPRMHPKVSRLITGEVKQNSNEWANRRLLKGNSKQYTLCRKQYNKSISTLETGDPIQVKL